MKIKMLTFHLLVLSMLLTSYSSAQSNSDYSSIASNASSQEESVAPHELNVNLSPWQNYSEKLKVGEELAINVDNPHKIYHSGENQPCISKENPSTDDLSHCLRTSLYSDSWNPWNELLSLEKELELDMEKGNPLVYHFKAVRPGKTYIYFHTTYLDTPFRHCNKPIPFPRWIGPKIVVEVSE